MAENCWWGRPSSAPWKDPTPLPSGKLIPMILCPFAWHGPSENWAHGETGANPPNCLGWVGRKLTSVIVFYHASIAVSVGSKNLFATHRWQRVGGLWGLKHGPFLWGVQRRSEDVCLARRPSEVSRRDGWGGAAWFQRCKTRDSQNGLLWYVSILGAAKCIKMYDMYAILWLASRKKKLLGRSAVVC